MKNVHMLIVVQVGNRVDYRLSYTDAKGKTHSKTFAAIATEYGVDWTRNHFSIVALQYGLSKLNQPCNVRVEINNSYIWENAERLPKWAANSWFSSKGKPVAHAKGWRNLSSVAKQHIVSICYSDKPLHILKSA